LWSRAVLLFVQSNETGVCPICGEPLFLRGWRLRGLIEADGEKRALFIRRLRCSGCGRIHHELPDCVVPYKRHCAETIEEIAGGITGGTPCEERTLRRITAWWSVMAPYFLSVLKALAEKYRTPYPAAPAFREIVRAAVNSNHWTFPNSICTRSACMSG